MTVKTHSFHASLGHAIPQHKLLSSHWFGVLKLSFPWVLFSGGVFLSQTPAERSSLPVQRSQEHQKRLVSSRSHRRSKTERTVSFHNFKSQHFKLSVSNPKSKYVAYLSVLSQTSNCQSLGRKNKHEILKTDRTSQSSVR